MPAQIEGDRRLVETPHEVHARRCSCPPFSNTVERAARNRPLNFILDNVETRVLGALVEKDVTTPDYYPLSLNALVNACNQKNNRDRVTPNPCC